MRKYIFLNFIIQIIMLFLSIYLFFDLNIIKFLISFMIIILVFAPTLIENIRKIKFQSIFHVRFTIICILLFIFLIVF